MRKQKFLLCLFLSACVFLNAAFALNAADNAAGTSSGNNASVFNTSDISVTPGAVSLPAGTASTKYPTSGLWNTSVLNYYYEGNNYAYGINSSGNEIIAYKRPDGTKIDLLAGAGNIKLYDGRASQRREIMLTNTIVSSFLESTLSDGTDCLTVTYSVAGNYSDGAEITAEYLFYEASVFVKFHITANAAENFSLANSYLERTYINGYKNEYVKINSDWIYPETLDYPYREFESLAYIDEIDSALRLYSFIREEEMPGYCIAENMQGTRLPLYFSEENGGVLDYTFSYSLAIADMKFEKQSADYLGLFRGKNSDFAAGIAPVTPNTDNSTLFYGSSVKLNLNVTNLKSSELIFSLRYDVRDYYGNVVQSGLFKDNKILKGLDANREIEISGGYGMYYLNLYVISENDTYTECYPFALLKNHTYTHNDTSPFGISSVNGYRPKINACEDYSQYTDIANICAKIGVANARLNSSPQMLHFADVLKSCGVNNFNGQYGTVNTDSSKINSYKQAVANSISALAPYVQSYEVGNEYNLKLMSSQNVDRAEAYMLYYNNTFLPTYNLITSDYPDIDYIPTSVSAGETAWFNQLANTEIWNLFDIISIHTYADCRMPDGFSKNSSSINGSDLWNIEDALIRSKSAINSYGNKKLYITEVGYNTAPLSVTSVDLRTQADYTVRIGVLGLGYGADKIQYYCFSDRTSYFTGFSNSNAEFNFGLFYEADYYGNVMPKPAAVAFAVMTSCLEGADVSKCCIAEQYDEGNTVNGVRAFKIVTKAGDNVYVAYSNREVLSNGKKLETGLTGRRTPNLPWNKQWKKTDLTTFKAVSDTVTAVDIMGNETVYNAVNGSVEIPLTGSPIYIYGVE